jgi:hypothetical protein
VRWDEVGARGKKVFEAHKARMTQIPLRMIAEHYDRRTYHDHVCSRAVLKQRTHRLRAGFSNGRDRGFGSEIGKTVERTQA